MMINESLDPRYEFVINQMGDAFGVVRTESATQLRSFFADLKEGEPVDFSRMHTESHLSLDNCHCIADALADGGIWQRKYTDSNSVPDYIVKKRKHY